MIGGLLHLMDLDAIVFPTLVFLLIAYFFLDLSLKKILIDGNTIQHGLCRLSIDRIQRIDLARNVFNARSTLLISDDRLRQIRLSVARLSGNDLQTLIDTVQKISPEASIDREVDAIIKYKRAKQPLSFNDMLSTVSISYHVDRVWEDVPATFKRLWTISSRHLGPLGTFVLCFPLWLNLMFWSYSIAVTDWGYRNHQMLYETLRTIAIGLLQLQTEACVSGVQLVALNTQNPMVLALILGILTIAASGIGRSIFSPNRITMDKDELSLDRWSFFFSYNYGRLDWNEIDKISLVTGRNRKAIAIVSKSETVTYLDLTAIDDKERARLLKAIKRFAPGCQIDPEVLELLEPPLQRSYTQLWLQSLSAAPQAKRLEPITEGTRLDDGRYEAVCKLGSGGQGSAYLCRDLRKGEAGDSPSVVLKELLIPPLAESSLRQTILEAFCAEAKILEQLDSGQIVKLIDSFVDERGAYLVLEHIEGKNLRTLVSEEGAMNGEQASSLAAQMLQILKLLHHHGIIHRDFTPENLILTPDGMLKLIDFNVAKDQSEGVTATIVGKQSYIPPEQFRGNPCKQSDLYAFGATLFFILTGFDPEPITQSQLPDLLRKKFPKLDSLIQCCTALEADARAASADELIALLAAGSLDETTAENKKIEENVNVISLSKNRERHYST